VSCRIRRHTAKLSDCSGSLYRVIPVHGRFYISTNYFCFRSNHLLYKTKVGWGPRRSQLTLR
jgi:hypothetical protein